MTRHVESWVNESLRRGERLYVIIRNETTGEEVKTTVSPQFIASLTQAGEIEKGRKPNNQITGG